MGIKSEVRILDDICEVISKKFPHVNVYTSDTEAGFKRPAFHVYIPNMYSSPHLFGRTLREYLIIVRYYPDTAPTGEGSTYGNMQNDKCVAMQEAWECMLYEEPFNFHVYTRRSTITSNVLNIKFNVKFRTVYVPDPDEWVYMQLLEMKVRIKYGKGSQGFKNKRLYLKRTNGAK